MARLLAVLFPGYSVVDDGGRVACLWGRGQWGREGLLEEDEEGKKEARIPHKRYTDLFIFLI